MLASSMPTPIGCPVKPLVLAIRILVRAFAEGCSERFDLRLGRTTTRWRVGFVREEDRVRCHRMPVQAPRALHLADESIDGLRHVFNVETGPVEGGVCHPSPEQFSIGLNATLRCFGVSLHHEGSGSHTEIKPLRRRSNGSAASSMTLLEDAAPEAANPAPIHDQSSGLVTLSEEMMTTRSARSLPTNPLRC